MLSIIFTYYNNPGMLARQYTTWREYPANVQTLVVDDGSQQRALDVPVPAGVNPAIYRMLQDKPWHQDAARNLGAQQAAGEWLLLLDIDHMISAPKLRQLLGILPTLEANAAYRFARRLVPNAVQLSVAPNIWLMRRADFWRVGGYDERLCGAYGTDRDYVRRVAKLLHIKNLPIALDVYTGSTQGDAATRGLDRTVKPIPDLPPPVLTLSCEWERQL